MTPSAENVTSRANDQAVWPWQAEPYKLWSLLDMLQFHGQFVTSLGLLPQVWPRLNAGMDPGPDSIDACFSAVKHLMAECERLQLPSSLAQCRSIETYVKSGMRSYQELGRQIVELYGRATDELNGRHLLMVTLDKVSAYEKPLQGWETQIAAFPSTQCDIEEAQRCSALDRPTASVFHLMRSLEIPLRVLSAELGIVKHCPTWDAYLREMADHIAAKFPDKSKAHADKRAYFTGLEGQLRAIKTAWRNPTMHEIAKVYTPEMANEIIVLVRGFMREAATELKE